MKTRTDIQALILRGNTLYNLLPIRTQTAVSDWVGLSEDIVNQVNTKEDLLNHCGRCNDIGHAIVKELAAEGLSDDERQRLTEFAYVVSDINGELYATAHGIKI